MSNIDLPPHAKSQIGAIMYVKEPNIVVDFVQVQEQHGYCDCSMFVVLSPHLCMLDIIQLIAYTHCTFYSPTYFNVCRLYRILMSAMKKKDMTIMQSSVDTCKL